MVRKLSKLVDISHDAATSVSTSVTSGSFSARRPVIQDSTSQPCAMASGDPLSRTTDQIRKSKNEKKKRKVLAKRKRVKAEKRRRKEKTKKKAATSKSDKINEGDRVSEAKQD